MDEDLPASCRATLCLHDPGLPDRDMREHVLAAAIRAADSVLQSHGYPDPERGLEILHVALGDLEPTPTVDTLN